MALSWGAKPVGAVFRYSWAVPLIPGDSIATASLTVSSGTASINSYSVVGDDVVAFISGGTAGSTTVFAASVTTGDGETIAETIYLPVVSPNSTAATVRDLVNFALRKVAGISETPDDDQAEDARERLQDMLELWRQAGADVGATRPLTLSTVIYCPESFLAAIKNNLIIQVADIYNAEVSPVVVRNATTGLAHIKQTNLSDVRKDTYF